MKRNQIHCNTDGHEAKNEMFFRAVFCALIWMSSASLTTVAHAADVEVATTASGSTAAGSSTPDYESREALPIAPRRYDGSDELSKTVFSSVSGNDPFEGLGLDAKAEVKPVAAPAPTPTSKATLANNAKPKKVLKKSALAANLAGKKPVPGKKQLLVSKASKKAAAKALLAKINRSKTRSNKQLAQQLPEKKRIPASSSSNQ